MLNDATTTADALSRGGQAIVSKLANFGIQAEVVAASVGPAVTQYELRLHESIRVHSQEAARRVKDEGEANDLMERLKADPAFAKVDLSSALDPQKFVGRAPEQVDDFVREIIEPIRTRYAAALKGQDEQLRV